MLKKLVFGFLLIAGLTATAGEASAYYPPYRGGYYYGPSYGYRPNYNYYARPAYGVAYVPQAYSSAYVYPDGAYTYNYGYYARPYVYPVAPVAPVYYGPRVGVGYYSPRVGVAIGF